MNTNEKTALHDDNATQTKSISKYISFQLEGCNCTRKILVNDSSKASYSENNGIKGKYLDKLIMFLLTCKKFEVKT